jgi:FMN phosphatase YigB (HAD superfamily)
MEHVLKEMGISPSEILLVDDSKRNIALCQELGVRCFHFTRQQGQGKTGDTWNPILELLKSRPSQDRKPQKTKNPIASRNKQKSI